MIKAIIIFLILPFIGQAQCPREDLKDLIQVSQVVASHLYDQYWSEWREVPKNLLLVEGDQEYLFFAKNYPDSFDQSCDSIVFRSATMNKYFLATFPLINNEPTIVIGTPENTGKTPLAWTITILHEHFHQLQFSNPDYYKKQKALNLDKGDETGMWMLNHPFPYEDSVVNNIINKIAENLRSDVLKGNILKKLSIHKKLKNQLRDAIGEEHYRYLNLQLWQEGYARFMELSILEKWIKNFDSIPQDRFTKKDLEKYLTDFNLSIGDNLTQNRLSVLHRNYFYALGAYEAKLISEVKEDWPSIYFNELFTTDHLLR